MNVVQNLNSSVASGVVGFRKKDIFFIRRVRISFAPGGGVCQPLPLYKGEITIEKMFFFVCFSKKREGPIHNYTS